MRIYLIMPVRVTDNDTQEFCEAYLAVLEESGHEVHFPPRDAPQDDPTGRLICETHLAAIVIADEVHVIWDVESKGSHFDLGMAYALRKTVIPVTRLRGEPPGKSYWNAVINPTEPA